MKHILTALLALAAFASATFAQNYTQYVDPTIGTGDHGHVFLGANVPQGMVNAGPTQINIGWDWCSGYHASGDSIIGFAQLHLSGTGCSDLGDISIMPVTGQVQHSRSGLASHYSHQNETTRPGYYQVLLDRFGINCEVTTTCRTALYRFTWPQATADRRIVVDLENAVGDRMTVARVEQVDDHTLVGFRNSTGWAGYMEVFFELTTQEPIQQFSFDGKYAEVVLPEGTTSLVKVALSPTSERNATNNRLAELPGWDFESVRTAADDAWNQKLSRIDVKMRTEREMRIFYTAMYHFMVAPQVWSDVNGDYMGADQRVYRNAKWQNFTTWSLWDTYRSAHPLATLILQDRLPDYAQTMLHIWNEHGELPVWHLASWETYCMVGCPGVAVFSDLIVKDTKGIDYKKAAKAIKESLLNQGRGLPWMEKLGYLPYEEPECWESVAKSMEYYIADWAAAQAFGKMGMKDDSVHFAQRSQGYKLLFDKRVDFMRAKDKNGNFRPLDGFNPCHQTGDYTEGTPWQYAFLVPHDVEGLVSCYGTREHFIERLDSLFLADSKVNDNAAPDISGLIGQYVHGNEPSHHILYLYNYVGQPWKTEKWVRQVMNTLYDDKPAGLCGNEDVGQMSAWYILSALGLYQVEPCGGKWQIGSTIVDDAKISIGEGTTFEIRTHNNSDKNIYVQKVLLNGNPLTKTYIEHTDILNGGTLDVYFGKKPSKWGTK